MSNAQSNFTDQEFVTILQLNVCVSLNNAKLPFVRELLREHQPEIVCLNEIGVRPDVKVLPKLAGYTSITSDLKEEFSGVATYVHDSLENSVVVAHFKHTMTKAQVCVIDLNGVRIINIYRSPNQGEDELRQLIDLLDSALTDKTVVVGDLNLRCNWLEYSSTDKKSKIMVDFLFEKNLVQYQFLITRPRTESILDVTLSNDHTLVQDATTDPHWKCDGVDHIPTLSRIRLPVRKSLFKKVSAKKQMDVQLFRELVSACELEKLILVEDIDVINSCVTKSLLTSADAAIPKFVKDLNKPKPLVEFTMSQTTQEVYEKQRKASSSGFTAQSKKYAKEVRKLMREDKNEWMLYRARKLDADNNEVWKMIRNSSEMGVATGGLRLDENQQELEFDPAKKPEILNQRYASVMTPKTHPSCDGTDLENSQTRIGLTDIEITSDDVLLALKSANNSFAEDTEGLHMSMVRKVADLIAPVLAHLFVLSYEHATLAVLWLTSLINPIPKPGDPTLAKSLRPVVLENTKLRIMEKVINTKIVAYLEAIAYFHPQQFGFRKLRNCILNLTDYWSFTTDLLSRKGQCDVIYMDTSAAFDRLSHGIILDKLYHDCGIAGKLWLWLKAWLTDREQFVRLNGHDSTTIKVTSSCMQGSCLGTTLWNIYINEVCWLIESWIEDLEITDCCFFFYADDVKIAFFPSEHNVKQMNRLLKMLSKEMRNLHLAFNPSKCSVLSLGYSNPKRDLYLPNDKGEDVLLKRVECERDLGLQVSSDGMFQEHIKKSLHVASLTSRFLAKIFHTSTWGTKVQLYYGLIFSRMSYASELWRPEDMAPFNKVYENFFKFAKPPKKCFPPWVPEQLMIKKDLILLWQIYNEKTSIEPWKIFPEEAFNMEVKRNRPSAFVRRPRYNPWTKNLVLVRNLDCWNRIPLAIRTTRIKDVFEDYIEEHVLPNIPSEALRTSVLNGDLRARSKRHLEHINKAREWSEWNTYDRNHPSARPDPVYEDDEFWDDFLVSDHCQKQASRKSKSTIEKLARLAPQMNLCHCSNAICVKEVEDFERANGPIRLLPKAYVDKRGDVRTKYGKITDKDPPEVISREDSTSDDSDSLPDDIFYQ